MIRSAAVTAFAFLALGLSALAADPETVARGQKEEARSCIPCHGLIIIHTNRLSRAAWSRELDKMTKWGAKLQDREALLEYLVANFGDDKPAGKPVLTGDGTAVAAKQ
jgi:mono/diheme cytochrome c family protein